MPPRPPRPTLFPPTSHSRSPAPPSFSPPARECSFVTCHVSKLTNPLLPLPPLQEVSTPLPRATFASSPAPSSLLCPPSRSEHHTYVPRLHVHRLCPHLSDTPL